MKWAIVALLAACAPESSVTVREVPPEQLPPPPPPALVVVEAPPPAPSGPFRVGEVWRGTYVCAQGETDLEVRIGAIRGEEVEATFDFSHAPSGAAGAYTMRGTTTGEQVVFVPGRWLRRPPNYVTVGMRGVVRGDSFTGRIDNPTCSGFQLRR